MLITQGSSEHSITVAVQESEVDNALEALNDEFESDIKVGKVEPFRVERGLSIGPCGRCHDHHTTCPAEPSMRWAKRHQHLRHCARFDRAQHRHCLQKKDVAKALRALHSTLFERDTRRIHLFCAGVGNVGGTLLSQIAAARQELFDTRGLDLRVVGLANSRRFLLQEEGVALADWKATLEREGAPGTLNDFVARMKDMNLENAVFVDNTASAQVASVYEEVLSARLAWWPPTRLPLRTRRRATTL